MAISRESERDYAPSEGMPPRPRLLTLYSPSTLQSFSTRVQHQTRLQSCSAVFHLVVHWLLMLLVGGLCLASLIYSAHHREMLLVPVMVFCAYWNWLSKELVRYQH